MCWSHHVISGMHTVTLTYRHWLALIISLFFFSPFMLPSLKENRYVWPTLKELVVVFYLLERRIPTKLLGFFCTGDLFLLSHLSVYPIYFYQQRFMEYIYITIYIYSYNWILYFVAQTLSSLAIGSSFSWLQYPFGIVDFFLSFLFLLPSFFLPFFSSLLHSGIIRCSRLILCLSYHDLKISHLSKKPSFLY